MERRIIEIAGIVQGVGFRPFVFGLATTLGLSGHVRNEGGAVRIDIEGRPPQLEQFLHELTHHPPALARIERVHWTPAPPIGQTGFQIHHSQADLAGQIFVSPDIATCDDCLREMLDPADRRYRYPFTNCTNCGPRLTIVTGAPYDRARTTMASFPMCDACRAEYENPADRRFHAQPIACPVCGPRIRFDALGACSAEGEAALALLVQSLRDGKIAAIKGLGGYHLAADATHPAAVAELRRRKHRDEKPLAVMTADLASAQAICHIDSIEQSLLISPARPIVLLRKRTGVIPAIADAVAPRNPFLGVMLPYTPLHHLLLRDLQGLPLVMTSGNLTDEPIAYKDDDAAGRLASIADVFLTHNRPIQLRCDDSVTRVVLGQPLPVRRSRGYAPAPIHMPVSCDVPLLAVGGQLKSTFALVRAGHAFLSQHIGDLDDYAAFKAFERDIDLDQQLLSISPQCIVHDLHPDYASTHYATRRAAAQNLPLIAVQHHHAHLASCMADNNLAGPVIGISFDGTGYGLDGAIWGGEFLVGDYLDFSRAAQLRYVRLPGGDQAVKQNWRMAASYLVDAGLGLNLLRDRIDPQSLSMIHVMIQRGIRAPLTSSIGRLFDAVASLIALRDTVAYEGQAAVELEMLATTVGDAEGPYSFDLCAAIDPTAPLQIDCRPMIRAIVHEQQGGVPSALIARRFHQTLARIALDVCQQIRAAGGPSAVTLSGGVFLNQLLTRLTTDLLNGQGFSVYRHRQVPPNDGGLSLGQSAIAAARLKAAGTLRLASR